MWYKNLIVIYRFQFSFFSISVSAIKITRIQTEIFHTKTKLEFQRFIFSLWCYLAIRLNLNQRLLRGASSFLDWTRAIWYGRWISPDSQSAFTLDKVRSSKVSIFIRYCGFPARLCHFVWMGNSHCEPPLKDMSWNNSLKSKST